MLEKFILNPAYMLSYVGDERVLLPCDEVGGVDLTEIIVLNETAFDFVNYIKMEPHSREDILTHLFEIYDISEEDLSSDIDDFISELDKYHAIVKINTL